MKPKPNLFSYACLITTCDGSGILLENSGEMIENEKYITVWEPFENLPIETVAEITENIADEMEKVYNLGYQARLDTQGNEEALLDQVWDVLFIAREQHLTEGDEAYDKAWDDVCLAMAHLREALGLPSEVESNS